MRGLWVALVVGLVGCQPADDDSADAVVRGDALIGGADARMVDSGADRLDGGVADALAGDLGRPDGALPPEDAWVDGAADADAPDGRLLNDGAADAAPEADAAVDAGPPRCAAARLLLSQATAGTVEVELHLAGLRGPSRLRLGRTERAAVPVPAGRVQVVARTATGEAPLTLLDREIDLACGERRALAVEVPAAQWLPPVARRYSIDGQRPPPNPAPFACGALRERARLEEVFDDDGNLRVQLTCPMPGDLRRDHHLELTFAAGSEQRSYALHRLRRTFGLYLDTPTFEHFQVEAAGTGFHPQVSGAAASPAPSAPGGPIVSMDVLPGGELAWVESAQTLDGVEVVPERLLGGIAVPVPVEAQPRTLAYRRFGKLPGGRLRIEWSHQPTPLGKLYGAQTCQDLPDPPDQIGSAIVAVEMGADPLYDAARFPVTLPALATPETRWVRVVRLEPEGDAPAACPTPWVSVDFSAAPGVAALCPDGSPPAPYGCGDPPPPEAPAGFVVDSLRYEPLRIDRDPDYYVTLDAYVTQVTLCGDVDDVCGGEDCVDGRCTVFGGQVCAPPCDVPANPARWPQGCVYRLSEHPAPEPEGPSLFEQIFGGIVTLWEYLAKGWNALVQGLVVAIAEFIPGCEAACDDVPGNAECDENWCGSLVATVVHGAFVALGLPPQAPSAEQLMEEGLDYVAEVGADALQDGTGVPSAVSEPLIREALARVVAEAREQARTIETINPLDPRSWGTPSPWHVPHPARVRLRLRRTADPQPAPVATLRGGALFFDRQITLPKLNPGQQVDLVVNLEPRIYPPIGEFYDPDVLFQTWYQEAYQVGAATLDLRLLDQVVTDVPAGEGWPGPVAIPTCE